MNPAETIEFFSLQAQRALDGLTVAKNAKNLQLLALNGRQGFKSKLMCGLVSWRAGLDARPYLHEAVDFVETAQSGLEGASMSDSNQIMLPIDRAGIIAFLLDRQLASSATNHISSDLELDKILAERLQQQAGSAQVEPAALRDFSGKPAHALAGKTYENYFSILAQAGRNVQIDEIVTLGERLFAQRSKDRFYSGGDQTEGGGQDNGLVVDYRLGAALKKAGYSGQSVHRWM